MTNERERVQNVYADYQLGAASSRWSLDNLGYSALVRERNDRLTLAVEATTAGISRPRVLDLGCGTGSDLGLLGDAVPSSSQLVGVELRFDALRIATTSGETNWRLVNGDATQLPFPSGSFDVVVMATVLSSILDDGIRSAVSAEICRVLAPGGAIVMYDMRVRNPANPHLRGVTVRRVRRLFPRSQTKSETLTLLPQMARRLPARFADEWYQRLARVPFLRSHRIFVVRPERPEHNVLHVTSAHQPGDPRIFLKECQTLARHGYRVAFAAPGATAGVCEGVEMVALPTRSGRRERFTKAAADVNRVVRERRPDVVHFHDPDLLLVALWWRVVLRREVVYDAHESLRKDLAHKPYLSKWQSSLLGPAIGAFEAIVARSVTHVVAATPAIAAQWKFPTTVVANYPVLTEWESIDSSWESYELRARRATYAGVIHEERCTDLMLAAAAKLHSDDVEIVLAGPVDGIEPIGCGSQYLGVLDRAGVAQLLESSRVGLVLYLPNPNVEDALPTKIMEYMAAGLPVVVSRSLRVGSAVVTDVGCGVAVDHDRIEEVVDAIRWVIDHPVEAWEMGQRGRQAVADRYSWSSEGQKLIDAYERHILGEH